MLTRKVSPIVAAAAMVLAPAVGAQSVPFASRLAAPVSNANYQSDDDDGGSTAVILGVVLIVLIGFAAVSGGGGDDEPASP